MTRNGSARRKRQRRRRRHNRTASNYQHQFLRRPRLKVNGLVQLASRRLWHFVDMTSISLHHRRVVLPFKDLLLRYHTRVSLWRMHLPSRVNRALLWEMYLFLHRKLPKHRSRLSKDMSWTMAEPLTRQPISTPKEYRLMDSNLLRLILLSLWATETGPRHSTSLHRPLAGREQCQTLRILLSFMQKTKHMSV